MFLILIKTTFISIVHTAFINWLLLGCRASARNSWFYRDEKRPLGILLFITRGEKLFGANDGHSQSILVTNRGDGYQLHFPWCFGKREKVERVIRKKKTELSWHNPEWFWCGQISKRPSGGGGGSNSCQDQRVTNTLFVSWWRPSGNGCRSVCTYPELGCCSEYVPLLSEFIQRHDLRQTIFKIINQPVAGNKRNEIREKTVGSRTITQCRCVLLLTADVAFSLIGFQKESW